MQDNSSDDETFVVEKVVKHKKWTPEEDALLIKAVKSTKNPNWNSISKKLVSRNPRQCKDRWNFYLSPDINNGEWSPEEDKLLKELFEENGSKWSKIKGYFQRRTTANVKNRWLNLSRKEKKKSLEKSPEKKVIKLPPRMETAIKETENMKNEEELNQIVILDSFIEMIEKGFKGTNSIKYTPAIDDYVLIW